MKFKKRQKSKVNILLFFSSIFIIFILKFSYFCHKGFIGRQLKSITLKHTLDIYFDFTCLSSVSEQVCLSAADPDLALTLEQRKSLQQSALEGPLEQIKVEEAQNKLAEIEIKGELTLSYEVMMRSLPW